MDSYTKSEPKHPQVDSDLVDTWTIRWTDRNQKFDKPDAQPQPDQAWELTSVVLERCSLNHIPP